jgi:hypothetical protein
MLAAGEVDLLDLLESSSLSMPKNKAPERFLSGDLDADLDFFVDDEPTTARRRQDSLPLEREVSIHNIRQTCHPD